MFNEVWEKLTTNTNQYQCQVMSHQHNTPESIQDEVKTTVIQKHKNAENNSGKCSMFWANNYQGGDKGPELQRLTTGFTGRPQWIRTQGALPNMQSGKNDAWQQWPMACQFSLERHVLNGSRFCFRWVGTTTCTGRSEDAHNHSRSQTMGGNNHHAFQHILWTCKMWIREKILLTCHLRSDRKA